MPKAMYSPFISKASAPLPITTLPLPYSITTKPKNTFMEAAASVWIFPNLQLIGAPQNLLDTSSHYLGKKQYELSNHLGNVLTVISDKKIPHSASGVTIDGYYADLQSATDYYAFGAPQYGRTYSSSAFRYGFNGKEKDDETYGAGNEYDFGERMYDPRLGRWLSIDKFARKYPDMSPYSSFLNDPIYFKDGDGNLITDKDGKPIYTEGGTENVPTKNPNVFVKAEVRYYYSNDGKPIKAIVPQYKFTIDTKERQRQVYNSAKDKYETTTVEVPYEKKISDMAEDEKFDCHGYVLLTSRDNDKGDKVFIQSSENEKTDVNMKNSFLKTSEYDRVTGEPERGDVALFGSEKNIQHSSILNKDKTTFTSKDENDPKSNNRTLEEQKARWGGQLKGYYRKKADKPTTIKSNNGKVTNKQAKQAIAQ